MKRSECCAAFLRFNAANWRWGSMWGKTSLAWRHHRLYREEQYVRPDSRVPTYASVALHVNNGRWRGVPFLIEAGKGLDTRMTEIRVQFRAVPRNLFCAEPLCLSPNELVIRVQPQEAIYFRIINKVPGLKTALTESELDLRYESAFREIVPDAYECLLLDVIKGEKTLFIRTDELAAAWTSSRLSCTRSKSGRSCLSSTSLGVGDRNPPRRWRTLPGSIFIAIIALLPSLVLAAGNVTRFPFGGTTVLIAVGVALETMKQIDSQLMMRNYEGFLK